MPEGRKDTSAFSLQPPRHLQPVLRDQQLVRKDVANRPVGFDLPFVENDDSVAQLDDEFQIVSRDYLGTGEVTQYFYQASTGSRIKVCKRLVEHQHLRMTGQDTRQANAFPLTSAKLQCAAVFETSQTDLLQALSNPTEDLFTGQSQIQGAEANILAND